jgi:hypothetical protein
MPTDGQAGLGLYPLDLVASGPLLPSLNMSGNRIQARAWDKEQQEAPAGIGATQGNSIPLRLSPCHVASSEHPGRSWAASHNMLLRLGLAMCRPERPRAYGTAPAESHDPRLGAASADLAGHGGWVGWSQVGNPIHAGRTGCLRAQASTKGLASHRLWAHKRTAKAGLPAD